MPENSEESADVPNIDIGLQLYSVHSLSPCTPLHRVACTKIRIALSHCLRSRLIAWDFPSGGFGVPWSAVIANTEVSMGGMKSVDFAGAS